MKMPDCFISFVRSDAAFARSIYKVMTASGLDTFLAPISIHPGQDWTDRVRRNLQSTRWVLFLASRRACRSAYVQQEVGGAFFGGKTIIPIVWDMDPSKLPGWARHVQAVDLRGKRPEEIAAQVRSIAELLRASRSKSDLITLALIGGLIFLASRK